jgi:hypothetical protein
MLSPLVNLCIWPLIQYVVSRVLPNSQPTHPQAPPYDVGLVTIDPHIPIIPMHVGENMVEDVLWMGGRVLTLSSRI